MLQWRWGSELRCGFTYTRPRRIVARQRLLAGIETLECRILPVIDPLAPELFLLAEDTSPAVLDIDGDGTVGAFSDGELLLTYLLDFSDSQLAPFVAPGGRTVAQVRSYLDTLRFNGTLDIDGDGSIGAFSDGELLLTYLLDFDDSQLAPFVAPGGRSVAEVRTVLNQLAHPSSSSSAPVNFVPVTQSTYQNTTLIFSSLTENAISVSDDAVNGQPIQVTLAVNAGLLTLSGVNGLTFQSGTGFGDASLVFTGTVVDINSALSGLSYQPGLNFNGIANLQVSTSDLGHAGTGAPQVTTSTVQITVNAQPGSDLTVVGTFNPNLLTFVEFTDGDGHTTEMPASEVTSTSVVVTVPVYVALPGLPQTGDATLDASSFVGAGAVSVTVRQIANEIPNDVLVLTGFQIGTLPQTGLPPGTLLSTFLDSLQTVLSRTIADYNRIATASEGTVDVSGLVGKLQEIKQNLTSLKTTVAGLMGGTVAQVDLGTADGLGIRLDLSSLQLMDRILATIVATSAPATGQSFSRIANSFLGAAATASSSNDIVDRLESQVKDVAQALRASSKGTAIAAGLGAAVIAGVAGLPAAGVIAAGLAVSSAVKLGIDMIGLGVTAQLDQAKNQVLEASGNGDKQGYRQTIKMAKTVATDVAGLVTGKVVGRFVPQGDDGNLIKELSSQVPDALEFLYNPDDPESQGPVAKQIDNNFGTITQNLAEESPGIQVSAPSDTITTDSGKAVTFTVVLTGQPMQEVTVPISSSDTDNGRVSPSSLTFGPDNWSVPQEVTVTGHGVPGAANQPVNYQINIGPAQSFDEDYDGLTASPVSLTNYHAGFTVVGQNLKTTSAGGSDTFSIKLTSPPLGTVTIPLSSDRVNEGTVSPSQLVFTSDNWSQPQTVTVTGNNNSPGNSPVDYFINLGPSQSAADSQYNNRVVPEATISVTNYHVLSFVGSYFGQFVTNLGVVLQDGNVLFNQTVTGSVTLTIDSQEISQDGGTYTLHGTIAVSTDCGSFQRPLTGGVLNPEQQTGSAAAGGDGSITPEGLTVGSLQFTSIEEDQLSGTIFFQIITGVGDPFDTGTISPTDGCNNSFDQPGTPIVLRLTSG